MKVQPIFLVLALVLGIGIGWLLRSGGDPSVSSSDEKIPPRAVDRPRALAGEGADGTVEPLRRETKARTMILGDGEEPSPEEKAMQDKISKAMNERQLKADERKIEALVQKLGLNASQEEELRAYLAGRRDELAKLFTEESGAMPDMSKFSDNKLDEVMEGVLSEEQKENYEEVKTAEREKKVESRALKDLAKLNSIIDLRPEQKDAVYSLLYEDAGSKVDKAAESGMSAFGTMFGGGFGVEMDLDTMHLHDTAFAVGAENEGGDPAAGMQAFREAQQKRIDDQVDRLAPVLDESQLEVYRESLEAQSSVFGSFVSPAEGE